VREGQGPPCRSGRLVARLDFTDPGYLPAESTKLWKRLLGEESERIFVRRGAPASASIAASRLAEQRR